MHSSQPEPTATLRPYEKPSLRAIQLVADQVLGVGCKAAGKILGPTYMAPSCVQTGCHNSVKS